MHPSRHHSSHLFFRQHQTFGSTENIGLDITLEFNNHCFWHPPSSVHFRSAELLKSIYLYININVFLTAYWPKLL
jgi:hypothetical protein